MVGGGVSPKSYQLKGSETAKSKNLSPMTVPQCLTRCAVFVCSVVTYEVFKTGSNTVR